MSQRDWTARTLGPSRVSALSGGGQRRRRSILACFGTQSKRRARPNLRSFGGSAERSLLATAPVTIGKPVPKGNGPRLDLSLMGRELTAPKIYDKT